MHTDQQLESMLTFMEKYKLTPAELMFAKVLLIATEDAECVKQYFDLDPNVRGETLELLKSLKDKGIITSPIPSKEFSPYEVTFKESFLKNFFKSSFDMGKELYDHYPISTIVNNVEYKLRRISKKFNSLEDAFFAYGKYIGWNEEKHKRIIYLVDIGKESGYVFSTLDAFIVDNDWNNLEELADKYSPNIKQL